MKEEIKTKIEQIKQGEVPSGYKKTKIGIFPVEWEEKRFKTMFCRLQRKNEEGNINVLTISAQNGLISQGDFFNKEVASEDKSNYYLINKGEWAYNKSYSSGYPFGAIKRLEKYEKGIVSPLYICFSQTQENKCPDFYLQYFENGLLDKEIKAIAQEGARNHGLLNMRIDDFFNTYLIAPTIEEQERIAEILKTQDRVIELKEKLLKEKQREKKYLMQQLLTGKIRLKGFTDEWEEKQLKDIAFPITKKVCDRKYEILSITAGTGFVSQSKKFGKEIAGKQYENYILLHKGEFSYNKGNSKKYPQGCIYPLEHLEVAAVPSVFISFSLLQGKCYYGYFKYLFENGCLNRQLYGFINSGVRDDGLLNIYDSDFYSCFVLIPTYKEQQKISEIFFIIDKEINLLQQQIKSEKQKKKALMQLLLSGIVRVS